STPETAPRPPKSPPGGSAPQNPTTAASSPPSTVPQGPDSAEAVLALAALAKKTARNATAIDPGVDTTTDGPNGTTPSTQATPIVAADASSTAAAIIDLHGDKTEKPGSSASDSAQAATPPADPSANQP